MQGAKCSCLETKNAVEYEIQTWISAPNEYIAIGFDDFVLFARVTKKIALRLCSVARPTDQQIMNMLDETERRGQSVNERRAECADEGGCWGSNPQRLISQFYVGFFIRGDGTLQPTKPE